MEKIVKKRLLDVIFYIAILIEVMIVILDKSAYIIQYESYWFRLTFALFVIKACFNKYTPKQWIGFWGAGVIAVISYKVTGRNEMLRIIALIAACKDMEPQRLLKTVFWTTLAGCIVLVVLSLTGVMGTVAITSEFRVDVVQTRYCFGMGHPNAFHCMVWALMTLGCYIYKDKLKLWHYLVLFAGNIIVFIFTDSRTAVLVTALVIILFAIAYRFRTLADSKWVYIGGIIMIIASVFGTIILCESLEYSALVQKINEKLSLRILAVEIAENAMPTEWVAFGLPENTGYFDMGIARLFYWYGWIPALSYVVMNIHLVIVAYKKKDAALAILVTTFMIYTVIEAHLISDYMLRNYLFVLYGLALTVSHEEKDRNPEYYLWDIRYLKKRVKA